MGLTGVSSMKKSDLVAAISAAQSGGAPAARSGTDPAPAHRGNGGESSGSPAAAPSERAGRVPPRARRPGRRAQRGRRCVASAAPRRSRTIVRSVRPGSASRASAMAARTAGQQDREQRRDGNAEPGAGPRRPRGRASSASPARTATRTRAAASSANPRRRQPEPGRRPGPEPRQRPVQRRAGGRRRRGRDRNRNRNDRNDRNDRRPGNQGNQGRDVEPEVTDDDVLVPGRRHPRHPRQLRVRADHRLPAGSDRRLRLAVHGQALRPAQGRRHHRPGPPAARGGGDRREKFNPLVKVETVNGADPEAARGRVGVRQADAALPVSSACAWRPTPTT